ncbi:MAG TPA: ThuA domain-containing protein [Lacipirellulaceae bacterium]|nr:ThuA domain-containing protein [Lacipirellulaceae bacterium]
MPVRLSLCRITLLGSMLVVTFPATVDAQGPTSFRMPEYPAEESPPPPRPRADVERLLAGAPVETEPNEPLRVVLVAGDKDHDPGEHDYPAWQKVWAPLLAKAPRTTIDTAHDFPTEQQVHDADVLVFYQRGRWNAERAAVIDPFLARGGGCVYIHWAIDGQGGQEEFAKRIGLASLGGSIKYRHGPQDVDFSPGKDHPIARNFDRIQWVDETYWKLTGDPRSLHLIATQEEEGEPQPLFWSMEHGRGRVFVSIPGHYMWTFDDPAFRLLLLRGIAWAGHRPVDRFNELVTLDARVE